MGLGLRLGWDGGRAHSRACTPPAPVATMADGPAITMLPSHIRTLMRQTVAKASLAPGRDAALTYR